MPPYHEDLPLPDCHVPETPGVTAKDLVDRLEDLRKKHEKLDKKLATSIRKQECQRKRALGNLSEELQRMTEVRRRLEERLLQLDKEFVKETEKKETCSPGSPLNLGLVNMGLVVVCCLWLGYRTTR